MKSIVGTLSLARSCGLAAMLVASTAFTPAHAEEIDFTTDNALAQALLPYAPWFFDIVVQSARSVAEISYSRRGYDPVTASFTVTDLHVKRDNVDVAVHQMRAGTNMLMLEGLDVDTRSLDLPPPLREALRRLGKDTITGDLLVNIGYNAPRSAYDLTFHFDLPEIGALAMGATVDGFHVLVPLSDIESGSLANGPVVSGTLVRASVAYRDVGLVDTATTIGAEQSGVSPDEMRAGLKVMPAMVATQMLDGLPGGASQHLRDMALGWARQAEAFLDGKGDIRIELNPEEPVALAGLQTGPFDERLIATLNPTVSDSFDAVLSTSAEPVGSLGAASALISGQGAPQDREAGAQTLMGLAATGNLDAVAKIGNVFGSRQVPALDPTALTNLYAYLLVARALDDTVPDATLALLGATLPPEAVLEAERNAMAYFHKHTEEGKADVPLSGATIADYDAGALRMLAFALYEGRGVPRNVTQAYAVALVAAAAGDPFAAKLRDDLAAAGQAKRIALSLADARSEAGMLWAAYQAAHGTADGEDVAPQ